MPYNAAMNPVLESDLERVTLSWFARQGYEILPAEQLNPGGVYGERDSVEETLLKGRLSEALRRLNPGAPEEAIAEAMRKLARREAPTLVQNNLAFHSMLRDGISVEIPGPEGGVRGALIRLIDAERPENNDWVVTSQVPYADRRGGTGHLRIPDVVVYLNGMPVAVLELKSPTASSDVWQAFNQLQTYKVDIPSLFATNAVLVISDDVQARIGTLTADDARFAPWKTVQGDAEAPGTMQPLQVLIEGVFNKEFFIDLISNFVTFEQDRGAWVKKLAGYHQFHAVRRALREAERAAGAGGDRRVGVVWHTQGSGKSLTMMFLTRKLVLSPALGNPTIVVLTDRNDLDEQLFATFSQSQALLRQQPEKARDRGHLRELLRTTSGGIYFTTVQKFLPDEGEKFPSLSERRNIIVIADEAHRSQYGFKARVDRRTGQMVYGFAKHLRDALPGASFLGFTGTPVDLEDKSTTQVFGKYISVYDIRQAVEDRATVPIYYENRLARIDLSEEERPRIDDDFEEVTEGEEADHKEALKTEWSTVEALVGTPRRLGLIAADLVAHFEKRQGTMEGKALVVCMSRRICAELHDQIKALRPDWVDGDDDQGALKVVMTGAASDPEALRPHIRSKGRRERLAERFRDPKDPLKIVIVRDMWLTGFDAPCLHTLYVDKPMKGHNLMQAIARVNRVFGDKPGGLIVDYIGIATSLKEAMSTYSQSGGRGDATRQQEKAVEAMLEKLSVCRDLFHGFDYGVFFTGTAADRLALLPAAREHVLKLREPGRAGQKRPPDGHDRFMQAVADLSSAFSLAMPHPSCDEIRDEVAFFQAVKVGLVKLSTGKRPPSTNLAHAVRQIVENAVVTEDVIDVFQAVGLAKPDLSILSPEFLAEVEGMKHRNLAAALLQRLLEDEVKSRGERNVVQGRKFSELLDRAIHRYRNRAIESAQVIAELIELARDMMSADRRGDALALSKDEAAFYEALASNESAQQLMGDAQLAMLARELTRTVRAGATVDWTIKTSVQAQLRVAVKRLLKKHGYPPDAQQSATDLVLDQARALGINTTAGGTAPNPGAPTTPAPAEPGLIRPLRPLPYPLAVFDSLVESQDNAVLRVKTRRDGFEKALSFLVAIELGLLKEKGGGKLPDEALLLLKDALGRPLSMGTWLELSWRLAHLLPAASTDQATRAVRALVTEGGKPSELARAIETEVVVERNVFAHAVTATTEEVADAEGSLHQLWQRFEAALEGLREHPLVVRAAVVDFQPGGPARYKLRYLEGGNDHFPVREQAVEGHLEENWCYLLRDVGPPVPLAPVMSCHFSKTTERRELFFARTLSLTPGARIDAVGAASTTREKLVVPA
jgi:type I restriction enzyme R subunit